eukprot:m.49214 g.49214  ORF g.49214 m.49214 type:complete len:78 (+) comp7441_c0_seq5:245-478(+)
MLTTTRHASLTNIYCPPPTDIAEEQEESETPLFSSPKHLQTYVAIANYSYRQCHHETTINLTYNNVSFFFFVQLQIF